MSYELLRPDIRECIRRGDGYCPCAIIKDEETDVSARSSEKVRKLTAIAAYGGNMTIGQRIRMYREKKGKSRAAMERETGISAATIYHYEMDGMEPTASRIIWLADYFNITADELLRRNQ